MEQRKIIHLDEGWKYVQHGIKKLTNIIEGLPEQPFNSDEYMILYSTTFNMSTQKKPYDYSQQLYERYKDSLNNYIKSKVLPSLRNKHDEYKLKELIIRWTNYKLMVKWLTRFFRYLDRYFVEQNSLPTLRDAGLTCFHDLVYVEVYANATSVVIALINKEREGELIDGSLLKNVLDMFIEIGIGNLDRYEKDFEKQMLDDTADYYKHKAANWIEENSCPDYMRKAEGCLKRERERASRYLHSSTEQKLIEKVQHELLVTHTNQLFEKEHSGCLALLTKDKVEDLSRMFKLYHKLTRCLESMANLFKQHITTEGTALVQKAEEAAMNQTMLANGSGVQEQVLIRGFIELYDKCMAYVDECFMRHTLFYKALKEAFEVFCNKTIASISSAELFAIFLDNILKKGGSEKLNDEAMEETFEKVIKLLVHIHDKDLFVEFFRKKLARRLLFNQSASDDHEKSFLSKLKEHYGGQFTSKMEGMITDLTLARDNQTKFEEFLHDNPNVNPRIDLTVTVLTTGFWPYYKSFDLYLPLEMVKSLEAFKVFYETTTKHRKLTWIYSLGSCNIIGKFESKTIELIVSTYQAAALLLFNKVNILSYKEIMSELNVTHEDLARLLHSLSCARYKILIKEPNTKTISPTDNFEFNFKFNERMRKIKIPLPPIDERKKLTEDVDKERKYTIDAAIVRIMKSKKVLGYQQLIKECLEMLSRSFKPDIKAIKKRIEDLINRDYLERDAEDSNIFKYVA